MRGKGNMVCKLWLLVVGKALSDNWNVEASKEEGRMKAGERRDGKTHHMCWDVSNISSSVWSGLDDGKVEGQPERRQEICQSVSNQMFFTYFPYFVLFFVSFSYFVSFQPHKPPYKVGIIIPPLQRTEPRLKSFI